MSKAVPLQVDVDRAVDLLAGGAGPDEVRALCPDVDPSDPQLLELAAWKRDSSAGARRLSSDYLMVRIMGLLDAEPPTDAKVCAHCGRGPQRLDDETKAKLLLALQRLRRR